MLTVCCVGFKPVRPQTKTHSPIARNNAEWYRLLELCGVTDTLIADLDGLYHPGLFNDRLLLGLKGTRAEAELHVLRLRLNGAIRNKAKRGELRRGLPVGLIWGEGEGQAVFPPDQAVTGAIRTVFEKFAELGSARQVWLWFRSQDLLFPHQCSNTEILWVKPTYIALHTALSNPVSAGAYAYGKSRCERYVDEAGRVRKRVRLLPQDQWAVLIPEHHPGFIDWATFAMNQARLASNFHPAPQQATGAVREGAALLQGLATGGRCGRHLLVYYNGQNSTPGYYCGNGRAVDGRGVWCLRVGGVRLDRAVVETFLDALSPAGLEAAIAAQDLGEAQDQAALKQFRLQVERTRYEAERAERRFRSVEPENRLVARTLETDWESKLQEQRAAEAELARQEQAQRLQLTDGQREQIRALGSDLKRVWDAPTTTDRDRKELLRSLIEEVKIHLLPDGEQSPFGSALEDHGRVRTGRDLESSQSRHRPDRRGYHRTPTPLSRASLRHGYCRRAQSPRTENSPRRKLHGQSRGESPEPLENPMLSSVGPPSRRRVAHGRSRRPSTRRCCLDSASVAQ